MTAAAGAGSAIIDDELDPLVEIEQRVQARAKDLSHDMAGPQAEAGLRALIDDEIERWADDAKRGVRRFELADPARVAERAFRNLARYGPLTPLLG
jgi:pilus assembly protein CpaF